MKFLGLEFLEKTFSETLELSNKLILNENHYMFMRTFNDLIEYLNGKGKSTTACISLEDFCFP